MEPIIVTWAEIKAFTVSNSLSIQYFEKEKYFNIYSYNGVIFLNCIITKDSDDLTDLVDFQTNFKPTGNRPLPQQRSAFTAKTQADGKSLYRRFTGISQVLSVGSNTFIWTQASFPLVKFLGIEVINGELGDTCDIYVLDTATGTYSGYANYTLNRFAYTANIAPTFYKHTSPYDATLTQGLQIKFVYNSVSAKTIYINLDINEAK